MNKIDNAGGYEPNDWTEHVRSQHELAAELKKRPEIELLMHYLFDDRDDPDCVDHSGYVEYDKALTGEVKAEVVLKQQFALGLKADGYLSADSKDLDS